MKSYTSNVLASHVLAITLCSLLRFKSIGIISSYMMYYGYPILIPLLSGAYAFLIYRFVQKPKQYKLDLLIVDLPIVLVFAYRFVWGSIYNLFISMNLQFVADLLRETEASLSCAYLFVGVLLFAEILRYKKEKMK